MNAFSPNPVLNTEAQSASSEGNVVHSEFTLAASAAVPPTRSNAVSGAQGEMVVKVITVRNAILQAADIHYRSNNLAIARDFLQLLDDCCVHIPESLRTLGNIHFLLGDFKSAANVFGRAADLSPGEAGLWVALALSHLRLNDLAPFQECLTRAMALDPENLDALKILADQHLTHGRYQPAALTFRRLINRHPDQVTIFLSLAKCFHQMGDSDSSLASLGHVLELDPANEIARDGMAKLQAQRADIISKPVANDESTSELPALAAELLTQADVAHGRGDLSDACEKLSQVLVHAPRFVPALVCLGNIQFQLGRDAEALVSYQTAHDIEPDNVDVLVRLAATSLRCQDVPRFEQSLARALELDANNLGAIRLLADLNFQNQRFADAARGYRQIVQQTPQDTDVLMALGRCEFERGELEAARRTFQQALKSNPSLELSRENLSVVNEKIALEAAKQFRDNAKINWGEVSAKLANLKLGDARA